MVSRAEISLLLSTREAVAEPKIAAWSARASMVSSRSVSDDQRRRTASCTVLRARGLMRDASSDAASSERESAD